MQRRTSVRKLQNAPLVQALVQIRFAAVLDMADRVPALQREFKSLGFPRYQETQFPQIVIVQEGVPQVQFAKQWQFLAADRQSAIVLATDFVTFAINSSYATFERFLDPLLAVLKHLSTVGAVELMDRLGLRYVDLIRPRKEESVSDYVQPHLLGLSESSLAPHSAKRTSVSSETQFATKSGTLVIRFRQLPPGAILPPDLNASLLANDVVVESGRPAFALDCDHFREGLNGSLDVEKVEKMLWELHDAVGDAFHAAITPHALKAWGPEVEASA